MPPARWHGEIAPKKLVQLDFLDIQTHSSGRFDALHKPCFQAGAGRGRIPSIKLKRGTIAATFLVGCLLIQWCRAPLPRFNRNSDLLSDELYRITDYKIHIAHVHAGVVEGLRVERSAPEHRY
jgi:hypothetical protein